MEDAPPEGPNPYRLDPLGWFQFEQLISLALEAEAGVRDLRWFDQVDGERVAWLEAPVALTGTGMRLPAPVAVAAMWVREDPSQSSRLEDFATRTLSLANELGSRSTGTLLVFTNLDEEEAKRELTDYAFAPRPPVVVFGAAEIGRIVDHHAEVRAAMPSMLGLRDLGPLTSPDAVARSTLDVARAQALARVFVPTRAYVRSREVLSRHGFVVLTGPPEMGKTAIAHMAALAQLTTGWEAHDCTNPEQVWSAFDRERAQVFVADDAFGSTEYRPDAAEHWAHELGRMLGVLDERHWLIWTSRPAPLRAGLQRVQRERGSEQFPAPGEVLVDASNLDLAEKTLILFRHVKDHATDGVAKDLVRSAGLRIVEHEHFTPERIRRFAGAELDALVVRIRHRGWAGNRLQEIVIRAVERELATPTAGMATSFSALEPEHRAMLIALLDTPAGLADERDLAATVRRHYPAGMSRPPHELIDRLTDHFLRISSLGVDWVHPSWRDLVIDELRGDGDARRRFLCACGLDGALLVLSNEGGTAGERALPLLVEDGDWDAFTNRVNELIRELEDRELARLLLAVREALGADLDSSQAAEAQSLGEFVLAATQRFWDKQHRPLPVFLLEAWYSTNDLRTEPMQPPQVAQTWADLHPGSLEFSGEQSELQRTIEWLALVETLVKHDAETLADLGFPDRETAALDSLADLIGRLITNPDPDLRGLAEDAYGRLARVAPNFATASHLEGESDAPSTEDRWWTPEDIAQPPTTERIVPTPALFTRQDVNRVLNDL